MTAASQNVRNLKEWHETLGHCNVADLLKMEHCVEGMKISGDKGRFKCSTCVEGKMTRYFSRLSDRRATKPLEIVHTDLTGKITPTSKDGHQYGVGFTDDFSDYKSVYFLKSKDVAYQAFEIYLADTAPFGNMEHLRSDGGESMLVRSSEKS